MMWIGWEAGLKRRRAFFAESSPQLAPQFLWVSESQMTKLGFYVYLLYRDEEQTQPFYVGKGYGRRMWKHGRTNNGTGVLANLMDGGEGASGHIKSAEAIAKTAAFHRGRKHSPEAIAKMRGRKQPAEAIAKISAPAPGRVAFETRAATRRTRDGARGKTAAARPTRKKPHLKLV
jgi:hypothetical protein